MKIDVNRVLKNYQGKALTIGDNNGKSVPLTVREALNSAINGVEIGPNGQPIPVPVGTKGRIYHLSTKLWGAKKEMKLSLENATFIQERAGKVANVTPLVYGRICDILEGENEKEKKSATKS